MSGTFKVIAWTVILTISFFQSEPDDINALELQTLINALSEDTQPTDDRPDAAGEMQKLNGSWGTWSNGILRDAERASRLHRAAQLRPIGCDELDSVDREDVVATSYACLNEWEQRFDARREMRESAAWDRVSLELDYMTDEKVPFKLRYELLVSDVCAASATDLIFWRAVNSKYEYMIEDVENMGSPFPRTITSVYESSCAGGS